MFIKIVHNLEFRWIYPILKWIMLLVKALQPRIYIVLLQ